MSLKFNEEKHEYTLNGKRLPSVSEVLSTVFGGGYDNVPRDVLNAAAEWGNEIHKAIELEFPLPLNEIQERQYDDFWELFNNTAIIVNRQHEQRVHTDQYAGTLDLLFEASYHTNTGKSFMAIGDIKTTYKLDTERTAWQLSLYANAYEEMTGVVIEKLFVYWLPKRDTVKAERVELQRKSKAEINELLKEFERKTIGA